MTGSHGGAQRGPIIYGGVNQDRATIRRIDHTSTTNNHVPLCRGNTDEPPTRDAPIIVVETNETRVPQLRTSLLGSFFIQRSTPDRRNISAKRRPTKFAFFLDSIRLRPSPEIYLDLHKIYGESWSLFVQRWRVRSVKLFDLHQRYWSTVREPIYRSEDYSEGNFNCGIKRRTSAI